MQGEHGRMDTLTTTKDGRALGDQSSRVLRYVVMLSLAVLIMAVQTPRHMSTSSFVMSLR